MTAGGSVLCWGSNANGELGDGTTTRRSTPTPVNGLGTGVTAIVTGSAHTCALTVAGSVLCWGSNNRGQIGDGTTTQRLLPSAVSGLESGVMAIAAGALHTCALKANGGVQCWGWNPDGRLGDGTTTPRPVPTAVSGLETGIMALVAGAVTRAR